MEELKNINGAVQFIVTRIGGEQYGIDINYVDNIDHMPKVTRVPNVPSYIKGVINMRGEVIPVMNIRTKMGLPEVEYTKNTRVIMVKMEQYGVVGLIVDEVREVVTLEEDAIEKVSYDKFEGSTFVMGVGKYQGNLISLLDLNAVLAE